MKKRYVAAAGVLLIGAAAASIYAAGETPENPLFSDTGPVTEQQVREKLTSAGFSDIRITQRNFFEIGAVKDGRTIRMMIDAQSGRAIQDNDGDD